MLKAVIFDFDGVIADSEALHYDALNTVFNRYGVDIPKEVHWDKYLGYSDRENIEAVNVDYRMQWDNARVQVLIGEKKVVFDELIVSGSIIIEGVSVFIQRLINGGVRRAICSGALRSDIDLMLAGMAFKDAFEVIVSADDVAHGKPDPEGYLLALSKLNQKGSSHIKANQCVVIEDSHWGLEAAAAAGMHPIAVTNTYPRSKLAQEERIVVDRLDELTVDELSALCE
ncbi:MAG: HAD family phosphatase [Planctomycetota bacterium]|nr:MAG: HAD family phosphatase [Planctomycetota bacterium]